MSHIIMIDEPNGNDVISPRRTTTATTSAINTNAATASIPASYSNDDLSLSLSEYTDADESMSAPTEFLAEFLSAVMLKDYVKALKYCKLILDFEPHNITAREFYPLIEEKLRILADKSASEDENSNDESSPDEDDDDADDGDREDELSSEDELEYSCDDASDMDERYLDASNKSTNSIGTAESENTTHSYSNSLLESEDDDEADDVATGMNSLPADRNPEHPDLSDLNNGNYKPIAACSDSESPTEPLTQKITSIIRSGFKSSTNSE